MEHHHFSAQMKQLLKRGYSIEDARNLIGAPQEVVDRVIIELQQEQLCEEKVLLNQHNQAKYAMGLHF